MSVPSHKTPKIYIAETDNINLKKIMRRSSFFFTKEAKKQANQKPIKYPIVGPVKYTKPTPLSGELENTGKPTSPSIKYKVTVANPILYPKDIPKKRTTKVCIVIGTG